MTEHDKNEPFNVNAIKKLTGIRDYNDWQQQMIIILKTYGLWRIVNGDEKAPSDKATEEKKADFEKRQEISPH